MPQGDNRVGKVTCNTGQDNSRSRERWAPGPVPGADGVQQGPTDRQRGSRVPDGAGHLLLSREEKGLKYYRPRGKQCGTIF